MDISTSVAASIGTFPMPIPPLTRAGSCKAKGSTAYPFDGLAVNQWFVVTNRVAATVRQAIQRYYLRHGREKRFVQRIGPSGHPTVWRVK